jgi:DNA replication and repair protein RecF
MYLKKLTLENYRSYENLTLNLEPGVTTFLGRNGVGKTNIVESILYLTYLSSHRTSSDFALIQLGKPNAYIRAITAHNDRDIEIDLEINDKKANRALVNKQPTRSQKNIFGLVQAIYFSPEDLDLVRGDPGERRKFLDQMMVLSSPRMAGVISDYDRALKQRNNILKTRGSRDQLTPWTEHVANFGGEIIAERINLLNKLRPLFVESYHQISNEKTAGFEYQSKITNPSTDKNTNTQTLLAEFKERERAEYERGVTLVGPHRDNLHLTLGDFPVQGYASHGESWSIALSLKLATYQLLRNNGIEPILILDDVFAELDEARREHITTLISQAGQTFISVADVKDIPSGLETTIYNVSSGHVLLMRGDK